MAKAKRSKKSPTKTPMRVPAHGRGALRVGGTNRGGTGRPPSELRERLRGSFANRIEIIEQIADGVPMQKASFPLGAILHHAKCPKCETQLVPMNADVASLLVQIDGQISASPKDRLGALDLAAKYGLGALKEVSVENVRERVTETLSVIRAHCPEKQASTIIAALRPVWA